MKKLIILLFVVMLFLVAGCGSSAILTPEQAAENLRLSNEAVAQSQLEFEEAEERARQAELAHQEAEEKLQQARDKVAQLEQTPEPATVTTPTPETSNETAAQRGAIRKANDYLRVIPFSRDGLIKQLEFEGISNEDAVYAVDNITVDWYKQAVLKAQDYLEVLTFTRQGLIDQLLFDGFTQAQAEHGADEVGL